MSDSHGSAARAAGASAKVEEIIVTAQRRNSKITYRVSLDHRFSDEVMGYVSWNTGFKSGGFNANSPGTAPYKLETLQAYEAGLKTDLFDGRLRLNTSPSVSSERI